MKRAFFALLLSFPLFAQDRVIDISAFGTFVYPSGRSGFQAGDPLSDLESIELETDQGYGAAVNVFWSNRISTEIAASLVNPELILSRPADGAETRGSLDMIPLTAVLQFHFFGARRIDPYVGIGGGYIIFDDIQDSDDVGDIDFERIDFANDVGLVANAGLKIGLSANLGLYVDAKYIPLRAAATPVFTGGTGREREIEIDPLILAAGISFSF
jgi:outer membrane protein W